jgi:hypothetical protein
VRPRRPRGRRGLTELDDQRDAGDRVVEVIVGQAGLVVEVPAQADFGAGAKTAVIGLQAGADEGKQVVVLALGRAAGVDGGVLVLGAGQAGADREVRPPGVAFVTQVVTTNQRAGVHAPVQVGVVVFRVGIKQFGIQRPVRRDETADTQVASELVAHFAAAIEHAVTGTGGDVPAVVEAVLGHRALRKAESAKQRATENLLLHRPLHIRKHSGGNAMSSNQ